MSNKVKIDSAWKFNVCNVYDYRQSYGAYSPIIDFIRGNHKFLDGDILEAGTFKGRLTAGLGLLLEEIGSKKLIHTYDTFQGFPGYDPKDDHSAFASLYEKNLISKKHWEAVGEMFEIRTRLIKKEVNVANISSSLDFSENSVETVLDKFAFLDLENIVIHQGNFKETMTSSEHSPKRLFLTIIDCDLYSGYKETLSYAWPLTVPNGMVFLDEYYSLKFPGPRFAVNEFLEEIDGFELVNIAKKEDDFERWAIFKR
jgi:hypothetical protein